MKKFHHSQLILNGLISCHPPTFPSGTPTKFMTLKPCSAKFDESV
jgi:hypothetical protein